MLTNVKSCTSAKTTRSLTMRMENENRILIETSEETDHWCMGNKRLET